MTQRYIVARDKNDIEIDRVPLFASDAVERIARAQEIGAVHFRVEDGPPESRSYRRAA